MSERDRQTDTNTQEERKERGGKQERKGKKEKKELEIMDGTTKLNI